MWIVEYIDLDYIEMDSRKCVISMTPMSYLQRYE